MYHPDETYEVSCYVPEGPQEIFNNTLSQVLDVSARLGHPMNISSITFPSTIDTFEWDYLYRIFLNSPLAADVKKLWQVLRARRATQVAYDLHRLSGDRVIKTHEYPQFSEWADWSSMMFIDYGTDSLNFTVAEIDGGVTEVMPGVGGWFTWGQSEGMQVC